jgi:hypothetical protein
VTAWTTVPGPATWAAHLPIVVVIDSVVFGLMMVMSMPAVLRSVSPGVDSPR